MKGLASLLALLVVTTACSSSHSDSPSIVSGHESGEFGAVADLQDAVADIGLVCKHPRGPQRTAFSERTTYCDGPINDLSVYASSHQADQARAYLPEVNPAVYFVFGDQWSVGVRSQADAEMIQDALVD